MQLPAPSARLPLPPLRAKSPGFSSFCAPLQLSATTRAHTLVHMQALVTVQGHPPTLDLFRHGAVAAAMVPNETTLFIVRCDSGGLTIRLIMSRWDIDGCLSILVFTKEPVPLLRVAVDTNVAC